MESNDLIIVFRRVSAFLTIGEAFELLTLNRSFYNHMPNSEFYRYISIAILNNILEPDSNDSNPIEKASGFFGIQFNNYESLYNFLKTAANLIKNPCGAQEFEFWEKSNGGNG